MLYWFTIKLFMKGKDVESLENRNCARYPKELRKFSLNAIRGILVGQIYLKKKTLLLRKRVFFSSGS